MHRSRHSPISGAGKVSANPERDSSSSSDEYGDGFHLHGKPLFKRWRKVLVVEFDDDDDEDENEVGIERGEGESADSGGNEEEEEAKHKNAGAAKPIGDVVRVSGSGERKVNHHKSFMVSGVCFNLGDTVLMSPEDFTQKPYIATIKDITHNISNGKVMLTGQRFYRPEEAKKKEGGSWKAFDSRELFYSFQQKEFDAETVMHTCVVHFVPLHKQLPDRKLDPGYIIQKVYDTEQKKLLNLKDKDFEDTKQSEIDPVDVEKEGLKKGSTLLPRERKSTPTDELKEALTEEETARNKPKDPMCPLLLDARCKRCPKSKVSWSSIIKAGIEQYELVCLVCSSKWNMPLDRHLH